ncbi:hypothetical protein HRR80_003068 [Exophiala dermatitidis]|uniref:N-acetyltransferase domain-containing protein n=1 Tax=Exophiala dermatitidis TaxID=5970 RepID=A0AAN6IWV0_EXODE|nr:hypothetical protein HRR87_001860 [Exophiala dermatitidis]KAJ8993028.1 hypothetical protein HRR80_003068 [Exophiala dermatitidis]
MVVAAAAGSARPLVFQDLRKFPRSSVPNILSDLRSIEKKHFAPSEVFPFDDAICAKQNTSVIVGVLSEKSRLEVVAYAVCVRWNHRLLLHKICVSPAYRRQGMGSQLMQIIIDRARCWSCRGIDLWVHETNFRARALYTKHEFAVQETVLDYYAPGKHGIKMSRILQP